MPGFGDSAFIILLALLLFGPKKLPVLARQLGKLMGDFRRASNEFRTQMEEELRVSEQADRQKQIDELQASAISSAADVPHTPPEPPAFALPDNEGPDSGAEIAAAFENTSDGESIPEQSIAPPATAIAIATAGDLNMMPPASGLPVAHSSRAAEPAPETASEPLPEIVHHG
jgi:sec-independent protein translocase protein TatB